MIILCLLICALVSSADSSYGEKFMRAMFPFLMIYIIFITIIGVSRIILAVQKRSATKLMQVGVNSVIANKKEVDSLKNRAKGHRLDKFKYKGKTSKRTRSNYNNVSSKQLKRK